jgi:hypothetical protein
LAFKPPVRVKKPEDGHNIEMSKITPDAPDSIDDYEQEYTIQEDDKSFQLYIPDSKMRVDKKRILHQVEKKDSDNVD